MAHSSKDYRSQIVALIITILIAATVITGGAMTLDQVEQNVELRDKELQTRAEEVYDGELVTKGSDVCYDICAQTVVSKERLRHDVLMVADNADGWITYSTASNAIPGYSFGNPEILEELVQAGLLEKRVEERFLVDRVEYRYVGPDGKYEGQLSDAELRGRLYHSLYVMEAWATTDELAASVPASHDRVRAMLHTMAAEGQIQRDRSGYLLKGQTHWGSNQLEHSPQRPGMFGLVDPLITVVLAALVLGAIMRFRNSDDES